MNESRIGKLPANVFLWLDTTIQPTHKYWYNDIILQFDEGRWWWCWWCAGWKRWNVWNIWFVSGLSGIMVDECFSALSLVILMIFSFCPEVQCITMSGLLFTNIRRTLDITPGHQHHTLVYQHDISYSQPANQYRQRLSSSYRSYRAANSAVNLHIYYWQIT